MKRITAVLCALAMLLTLAACTKKNTDYSNQTLIGKVISIDGTNVTMQLGELSTQEGMQQPAELGDGQTPPELPADDTQENQQTPPEMPAGDAQGEGQTPPEMPGGADNSGETPPSRPEGDTDDSSGNTTPPDGSMAANNFTANGETVTLDFADAAIQIQAGMETTDGSLEDITTGTILSVETGDQNTVKSVTVQFTGGTGMQGGGFGGSGTVTQGSAANTLSTDGAYSNRSYLSTGDDENALRVDGASVTLTNITVDKSAGSSSNTEDGDFYGMNAALLATNGATVTIQNSIITSSAQNGNGVFSYGSGTTVYISDSSITTTADNSGGIQTTGGGTTNASNLTVETSGSSSAAIRSDRGGGTVNVDGGSYTTNGYNSPAVYSTADITVKNAMLTANNSEALVIEGKNSIALENCVVSGNMSNTKGSSSDENVHNVMIYQSMSGDAEVGTSAFSMSGGSLTSYNGDLFYVTNTHCVLTLSGVELIQNNAGYLLHVAGNSATHGWGTAGQNGGQVEFTANQQTLEGDIVVDTISTLDMTLAENSHFTGTINIVENAQGGAAVSNNAALTIESGSVWTLTGDCTLTTLNNNGTIHFNGYTITLADGTVLK